LGPGGLGEKIMKSDQKNLQLVERDSQSHQNKRRHLGGGKNDLAVFSKKKGKEEVRHNRPKEE